MELPEYKHDFPAGAGRFVQRGGGYEQLIVNGQVFMEHGEHTGIGRPDVAVIGGAKHVARASHLGSRRTIDAVPEPSCQVRFAHRARCDRLRGSDRVRRLELDSVVIVGEEEPCGNPAGALVAIDEAVVFRESKRIGGGEVGRIRIGLRTRSSANPTIRNRSLREGPEHLSVVVHDFLGQRHLAGELGIVRSQSVATARRFRQEERVALADLESGHGFLGQYDARRRADCRYLEREHVRFHPLYNDYYIER